MASHNFVQYIVKSVIPLQLSAYYPLPERIGGSLPQIFGWSPFIAAVFIATFIVYSRRDKTLLFGGLFFIASIFLVLNFLPLGNVLMADRYAYLSYIGIFIIMAQALVSVFQSDRFSKRFKNILVVIMSLWCAVLFSKSYERTLVWGNSETFWADVIDNYPREAFAYYNLADYYVRTYRIEDAIKEYSKAIEVNPRYFSAHNNRGNLYLVVGEPQRAVQDYFAAIAINPSYGRSYFNLAGYYENSGRIADALNIINELIKIEPQFPQARASAERLQDKLE